MSLVLSMTEFPAETLSAARAKPAADASVHYCKGIAAGSAAGFTVRKGRRWTGLVIVALHLLLLWALAHYRVVRHLPSLTPPLFVQLMVAPAEVLPPAPALQLSARLRLPDPPAWVPPPEVRTAVQAEPVVVFQSVAPPTTPVVTAEPAMALPILVPVAPAARVAPPQLAKPQMLPSSALRFSQAPVVEYPRVSRRNKESGVVWIRAWVGAAGGASREVRIERSSGFVRLDEAAVRAVQQARFSPSLQDGQSIEGWAVFPIHFSLES